MMSGESDQHSILAKSLAYELAHVHFSIMTHLRRAGVAKVGIVRPDNRFGLPATIETRNQIFERLDHVPVAQVSRRSAPAEHRPVILFRILHPARVLLCEKEFLRGHFAIAA